LHKEPCFGPKFPKKDEPWQPQTVFPRNLGPKTWFMKQSSCQVPWTIWLGLYHLVPFPKEVVPSVSSLKKLSKDYMFFSSILSIWKKKKRVRNWEKNWTLDLWG
jgi:hypothetical protein